MISIDEAKLKEQEVFKWYQDNKSEVLIPPVITDKNFLKAILKELDKNLKSETKFE